MDREPWGAETAEPWVPDPTGEEYVEWRESVRYEDEDGTSGQDRDSYSDTQDRDSYMPSEEEESDDNDA